MIELMARFDLVLAFAGLGFVLCAWVHYFWTIASGTVPRRPIAHAIALLLGMSLAVAAVAWAPVAWLPIVLAPVSLGAALLFFWLWSRAPLPDTTPNFAVGSPMPAIRAWTHRGEPFDSATTIGQRALIKFFRGHW